MNIPVYQVKSEMTGRERTLHRYLLLPVGNNFEEGVKTGGEQAHSGNPASANNSSTVPGLAEIRGWGSLGIKSRILISPALLLRLSWVRVPGRNLRIAEEGKGKPDRWEYK